MTKAVNSTSSPCTPSSSTPAVRRSTAFKRENLRPTRSRGSLSRTPSSSFEAQDTGIEEHEHVVAERNMLRDELARRNEEIKKLKAVIDCALKDLSNAVNHLKEGSSSNEEENGRKIAEQPSGNCELGKVEPKTPEGRAPGKGRNQIWGRSNGDDSRPPSKKSCLSRSTGRSFP